MNKQDVEKLAKWSEAKEVQTKYGPRMLRKADVTEEFSAAWKTSKPEIKAFGAGFSKQQDGTWELTWWEDLSADVKAHRQQSLEDSKAVAADVDLPHPDGMDYFPFQKAGIKFGLARSHVLFGDEMGLGKTIQAIGILNADPSIESALIICPKSLKLNWQRELEKWLTRKLTVGVVNGGWPDAQVVVINYDGLGKYRDQIMAREWGALIIDECHLIKNAKTQRSIFIKGRPAKGQQEAVEPIKARRHIRLTGTPIVNRPVELYNLISDMGSWGSFFGFAKRYASAQHNGWGWDFSGAQNLDELQRRLRETIMVRRLKSEVLTELPRKIRQVVLVEPETPEQKAAISVELKYERDSEERKAKLQAEADALKDEGGEKYKAAVDRLNEAINVAFTEMARLSHDTAMAKVPAVIAHIENALEDNDQKVIIAAHHHDVVDALAEGLAAFSPVLLTGRQNEQERVKAVDAFQADPQVRVFIGSIAAAGVGITLTASSYVVFAELDWVPGNMSQMEDRAHRIGQTETVLVQHIVLNESLDARKAKVLIAKQRVIDEALDKDHLAPVYPDRPEPKPEAPKPPKPEQPDLPDEMVKAVQAGLRLLAGTDPDYAREVNDIGFNKLDGEFGHKLAGLATLTPRQAAAGLKMLKKYHRQLPDELKKALGMEDKPKKSKKAAKLAPVVLMLVAGP